MNEWGLLVCSARWRVNTITEIMRPRLRHAQVKGQSALWIWTCRKVGDAFTATSDKQRPKRRTRETKRRRSGRKAELVLLVQVIKLTPVKICSHEETQQRPEPAGVHPLVDGRHFSLMQFNTCRSVLWWQHCTDQMCLPALNFFSLWSVWQKYNRRRRRRVVQVTWWLKTCRRDSRYLISFLWVYDAASWIETRSVNIIISWLELEY